VGEEFLGACGLRLDRLLVRHFLTTVVKHKDDAIEFKM
jgi:hypothetical protein